MGCGLLGPSPSVFGTDIGTTELKCGSGNKTCGRIVQPTGSASELGCVVASTTDPNNYSVFPDTHPRPIITNGTGGVTLDYLDADEDSPVDWCSNTNSITCVCFKVTQKGHHRPQLTATGTLGTIAPTTGAKAYYFYIDKSGARDIWSCPLEVTSDRFVLTTTESANKTGKDFLDACGALPSYKQKYEPHP